MLDDYTGRFSMLVAKVTFEKFVVDSISSWKFGFFGDGRDDLFQVSILCGRVKRDVPVADS